MKPSLSCIFVTGAASGIGRALVGRLIQAGYGVLATDFMFERLEEVAREDGWQPDRVVLAKLDVRVVQEWEKALGEAVESFGQVDVLCNVAGYLYPGHIQDTTPEAVDKHIDTNIKGVILGVQVLSRHMLARKAGHIINVASLAGLAPVSGLTLYSASKFGVRGFSLAADGDLRPQGIPVTTLCPDAVETPMLASQVAHPEAALTFSGPRALTTGEVCDAILQALKTKPGEVMLPLHRGLLAKLASLFPDTLRRLEPLFVAAGRRAQAARLKQQK